MLSSIWHSLLYQPLLNALAFLVSIIPGGNVGVAVILLTIFVRLILFPLSQKSIKSQAQMNLLTPELNKIKASGASKEEQAQRQFELYRQHKVNPFSGCLLQIPIIFVIIALYTVFLKGVNFESGSLYSFVHVPAQINVLFFGLDITKKSFILAALAGVSQYLQARFMPQPPAPAPNAGKSFQDGFARSLNMQMKYFFPIFIFIILYTDFLGVSLSGAIALYWITSNLFSVGQQIYVNKKIKLVPQP